MTSTSTSKDEKTFETNAIDRPINWSSSVTEQTASSKEEKVDDVPSSRRSSVEKEKQTEDHVARVDNNNDVVSPAEDESHYLTGPRLYVVMLGLGLAGFLVGLVSVINRNSPKVFTALQSSILRPQMAGS